MNIFERALSIFISEPTINKNDTIDQITITINSIENVVIPTLEDMLEKVEIIEYNHDASRLFAKRFNALGVVGSEPVEVIGNLKNYLMEVQTGLELLLVKITKEMPKTITNRSASSSIIIAVNIINTMSDSVLFLQDFLFYVVNEACDFDNIARKRKDNVVDNIGVFRVAYDKTKDDFIKTIKDLDRMEEIHVDEMEESTYSDILLTNKNLLIPNGFVGNPIYHFRKWLIEKDVGKMEALEDKRRIIRNQLDMLKLKQNDSHSDELEKAIDYYESKLNKVDKEMERLKG